MGSRPNGSSATSRASASRLRLRLGRDPYDARGMGLVERLQSLAALTRRHNRAAVAVQVVAVAVLLVALAFAVHGAWANAGDRLRNADYVEFGLSLVAIGAYYLPFVVGWTRILAAWGVPLSYGAALRPEMV